ncbi:hypothetical protein [Nitratireductor sp. ZSWI3]|uniref:hypothetical protein n=1 Tax=Nitratireductor sp. ZSWI3 TaxID=2966359 RepID=UPI00215016A1|nr:hypothetical protein [Nitratireductor sp. ZSWI3]MCR4267267.1 hypothetical protein [Nitratireductor sp. ZSWI3]
MASYLQASIRQSVATRIGDICHARLLISEIARLQNVQQWIVQAARPAKRQSTQIDDRPEEIYVAPIGCSEVLHGVVAAIDYSFVDRTKLLQARPIIAAELRAKLTLPG